MSEILDVLVALRAAAARKWQGNPAAQRAGLFARAADEIERLYANIVAERERSAKMRVALELIAAPVRPDGSWNRDREACRLLAAEALGESNVGR